MKKVVSASVFGLSALFGFAAKNGLIIDGLNDALAQTISPGNGLPVMTVRYHNPFDASNPQEPASWMIDCQSQQNQSCESAFAKTMKQSTGDLFTYVLLDFPSINTDLDPNKVTLEQTCSQSSSGEPQKFISKTFNYVAPFPHYSQSLGDMITVCVSGSLVTKAFSDAGYQVIPLLSSDGSALSQMEAQNPDYLTQLAELIATSINQDPSASGIAFDIEPSLKGVANNTDFFGTLISHLNASKVVMIYNGDWQSLSQIPSAQSIIALGAMYDFGVEGENHWFQDISPRAYETEYPQELSAFLKGYARNFQKMIVLPSAASDTIWENLDLIDDNDPETVSNYDPYLTGGKDAPAEDYTPPNGDPDLALKTAPVENCPLEPEVNSSTEKCYLNPYQTDTQTPISQSVYLSGALNQTTLDALKNGTLRGVILYNVKPDNFYELNCNNSVKKDYLCLSFQPESTSAAEISTIQTFNTQVNS